MLINRANEILNQTSKNIEVLHNGNQVWIEGVNATTNTAVVTDLSNNKSLTVPVDRLNETGMEMR